MRLGPLRSILLALSLPGALVGCATDTVADARIAGGAGAETGADARAEVAADASADAAAEVAADTGAAADAPGEAAAEAAVDGAVDAAAEAMPEVGGDAGAPLARIEELYADRFLNGDKSEFVELTGVAGTPLDTLSLRLIDATGKVAYEVAVGAAGATMPAAGRWVVGAFCVTASGFCPQHVDQTYSITTWGLAGDLGAVQLVRNDGSGVPQLLDVVAWGGVPSSPATAPTSVVEGAPAALSDASGHSIGRAPGAADQHDNAKDFCRMAASAGSANGACL